MYDAYEQAMFARQEYETQELIASLIDEPSSAPAPSQQHPGVPSLWLKVSRDTDTSLHTAYRYTQPTCILPSSHRPQQDR